MSIESTGLTLRSTGECISRDMFREQFMRRFYDPAYRAQKQILLELEVKVWSDYLKTGQPHNEILGRM